MDSQTLKAEVRNTSGKGPARQLRMKGLIPAVFYGPGKTPTNLAVSPESLAKVLSGAYGRNQLVELDIAGKKELTLVRDLEVEPVTRELLHADFYAVSKDREVRARVPFTTTGRAVGVQKGGKLRVVYRDLPVVGAPDKIPASIEIDVSALDTAQSYRVKEVAMPAGVRIDFPAERVVASIESKEKELPEEGAEGGAPAAAAAAPAAAAKAAPAKDDKKKK
ncbi:50S ribosomal protein L25 [Sandaracinus amylolyticus]|uniref:50S ribosomal protein L25 n=1 Tax=Sandaracinus amylolyticus TaxID=927083 RepID=UPI0022A78B8E|nr:50S ribosomal protein L25 [Sandaracinus amylolyticus]UJR79255.1 50S ribosomal protein L25 [Sandaracinus amylolyticus]